MKEIIYLDTTLVNSLLAQLNEGLINKFISETGENKSNQQTKSNSSQYQISGDGSVIPTLASVSANYTNVKTSSQQEGISTSAKDLIETALDDYSLDVLINSLIEENKIKNTNYKDGDIIKISGDLTTYNFKQLESSLELEIVEFMLPDYRTFKKERAEYDKIKNQSKHLKRAEELKKSLEINPWNNFKNLRDVSRYFDKLIPNSNLIKIRDSLAICPLEHYRINEAQLSFMQLGDRKATLLASVSSTINEQIPKKYHQLSESSQMIKLAPTTLMNILLGSFNLIQNGDFIVRPIAIYFED